MTVPPREIETATEPDLLMLALVWTIDSSGSVVSPSTTSSVYTVASDRAHAGTAPAQSASSAKHDAHANRLARLWMARAAPAKTLVVLISKPRSSGCPDTFRDDVKRST